MSNTSFKLFADKMGATAATQYIGKEGEIFYDIDGTTPIRLSDGVTPGGIPFGITNTSTTFTPQFKTVSGTLAGTVTTGSYILQGLICHFRINVNFAATSDFGSAIQYQFTLPFATAHTVTIRGGTLHAPTPNDAIYHIAGITDIAESSTIMKLYYSGSTTDLAWKSTTPVDATNTASHFDISGAYQIAS